MLSGLKAGNHKAFTDIFDIWKHKVYYYYLKKTKQEEAAKDLTQQVFLKLWKYRDQITEEIGLDQQIFQKARQVYLDWLKKEASYRQHFETAREEGELPAISVFQHDPELKNSLHAAINTLPEKRKKVFELKHIYGYSYKEISSSMGISVRTVDNHLLKALSQLRKVLGNSHAIFYILFFWE